MTAKNKQIVKWVAFGLSLLFCIGLLVGFCLCYGAVRRGKTYVLSASVKEGHTIFTPKNNKGYRYGPTMMYNGDGLLEVWFSSLPESAQYAAAWDVLTYRCSADYGETWSDEYVSVAPLAGSEEEYSVCDPGVIFMDGYYYMFYTSTIENQGRYNNVYSARATAPDAEWQRWNGKGWGGDIVKPVITYGSNAEHYGIGEPSVVVVDGKLYLYYTYKGMLGNGQIVNQTRLAIGHANENFPLTLSEYGVVVGGKSSDEDSLDVKYVDDYDIFIAITTDKRMSYRSRIKLYWSYDGKNFKEAEIDDKTAKKYLHNIGITGDGHGHIDPNKPQFISYAYSDGGVSWGNWNTEFQQITFSIKEIFDKDKVSGVRVTVDPDFENGVAPDVWALSQSNEYRSAYEAYDNNRATFYSSVGHNISAINEWHLGKWFNEALAIKSPKKAASAMIIAPRLSNDGVVYGFPKSFKIQYSHDGVIWNTISEYTDYMLSSDEPIEFKFGKKIKESYFRILATELGEDEFGTYIFQISEIALR